ncbi:hydrogenase maturation protease [Actinomadura meridiana]|uniref:Hydrogenase maturation protease n=1 Tax=Actinomadura meridiana TaxID=559626 RepID=A0ABP8CM87_9ACTN
MSGRVLVAGIGNVFLGDDGFGVEVVRRVDAGALPPNVDVVDYGIRGVHLAYELLDGRHRTLIMVDAVPLDGPPGTLAVIEPDPGADLGEGPAVDGHGMNPVAVLRLLRHLGGDVGRVLVVGCRPDTVAEGMELSKPVRAAVDEAVRLVTELAREAAEKEQTHA